VEAKSSKEARAQRCADAAEAVLEFLQQVVRPAVEAVKEKDDYYTSVLGFMLRLICWGKTFRKLREPADFQAASAGARSVLEITVALAHLAYGAKREVDERLRAWEESAKLSLAEARLSYAGRASKGVEVLNEKEMCQFAEANRARIKAMRAKYWGTERHVDHWNGQGGLEQAAQAADRLIPDPRHKMLEEFYQVHVRRMQWSIHGSGLAFERSAAKEQFDDVVGLAQLSYVRTVTIAIKAIEDALGLSIPEKAWDLMRRYVIEAMSWEEEIEVELAKKPEST
jgi:hypothetical protein